MTLFNKDVCIYMHTDSDLSYITFKCMFKEDFYIKILRQVFT